MKRVKADLAEEEKQEREIKKQIERVHQSMPNADNVGSWELKVESGVKIGFALGGLKKEKGEKGERSKLVFEEVEDERKRGLALEELMREEERKKEMVNRKDYWVCEGIIVKVMSKALAEKGYYKQKGVVKKVIDKYVGEIEMLESKHVLRVDQPELETVIPQIGCLVKMENGAYRGSNVR
ncbi:hypothetical protein RchiOBHm_Chr2g0124981 [Rosa chinensis]|uniref:KN17 SH3-like domain-containing protein n=1 Tax=Rosa chinensis TaxID=74649 RepID=A0A2P6RTF8_ROSCH|nr:hypothetical protein RchiOBHm_Chr2g0124981 [Rosa chinensis]